jgi:hypothetical protein
MRHPFDRDPFNPFSSDPLWDDNSLLVELWPSPDEIKLLDPKRTYVAGLQSFYDSHDNLKSRLAQRNIPCEWYTNLQVDRGNSVARAEPPVTAEIVIQFLTYFSQVASVIALFQTLKLWIDAKRGRQVMLKFGDFVIESTRLSEEDFGKLIRIIIAYKNSTLPEDQSREKFREFLADYPKITSEDYYKHLSGLSEMYSETKKQAVEQFMDEQAAALAEGSAETGSEE